MAVHFNNPDSKSFFRFGIPIGISDWPLAGFIRFNPDMFPGGLGAHFLSFTSMPPGFGGYDHFSLGIEATPNSRVFCGTRDGVLGGVGYSYAAQHALNEWQSAGFNFISDTSRQSFRNGIPGVEDTTFVDFPNGTEDILIGTSPTTTVGTYVKGYKGCLQDLTIWAGTWLSLEEQLALHTAANPWETQPGAVFRYVPLENIGNALNTYVVSGGILVPSTSLIQNVGSGALTTCASSPEEPPPEPEEDECGSEDEPDAVQPVTVTWPMCDLVPSAINFDVDSPTVSAGRSLSGFEQVIQADAGLWRGEYKGIKVWTEEAVLLWREIQHKLNGRNGVVLVPVYAPKLSATPIAVTNGEDRPIGAVRLKLDQTAGADIRIGLDFSTTTGRLYRLSHVFGEDGDGFIEVKVFPPLREPIEAGEALDFNTPKCRCRLESDDGMNIMLEHLKFAQPNVRFVEDV